MSEKFWSNNWEGRPRVLDSEIGSYPSDSINKKTCKSTNTILKSALGLNSLSPNHEI